MNEKSKTAVHEHVSLITKRATAAVAFMGVLGSSAATARANTSASVIREAVATALLTPDEAALNLQAKRDVLKLGKEIVGFKNVNPDKPNSFVHKSTKITKDLSGAKVAVTTVIVKTHDDSHRGYVEYHFSAVMP